MIGVFYPENNERVLADKEFETVDKARNYLVRTLHFDEIENANPRNKAAFIRDSTGVIVVVRELEGER